MTIEWISEQLELDNAKTLDLGRRTGLYTENLALFSDNVFGIDSPISL